MRRGNNVDHSEGDRRIALPHDGKQADDVKCLLLSASGQIDMTEPACREAACCMHFLASCYIDWFLAREALMFTLALLNITPF